MPAEATGDAASLGEPLDSLEQDADLVLLLFREAYYLLAQEPPAGSVKHLEWEDKLAACKDRLEINIAKQRQGTTGMIACFTAIECNAFYSLPDQSAPPHRGRGRRPVINVSWDDAQAYVAWLSRRTGKTCRLLSESEREYVARAGTTTPFWWGASISTQQANFRGNSSSGGEEENRLKTVPVDSFASNQWGLYRRSPRIQTAAVIW
jgi:formylglycine-generating enzyme required for sulfatase activity